MVFGQVIVSLVWLMSMMLAPHSLSLLGNLAGETGPFLPIWMTLAFACYALNVISWNRLSADESSSITEPEAYRKAFGEVPAALIPLSGRVITAVIAGTVLLVTSGFLFNEIFVRAFPNFGFAFAMLGVLMGIHFAGHRVVLAFQIVSVGIAFAGLAILAGIGLTTTAPVVENGDSVHLLQGTGPIFSFLLLLVGFDLFYLCRRRPESGIRKDVTVAFMGLFAVSVLLGLWGLVSIHFLPMERLADTTIAHVLVAKKIWGQAGRALIGVVAIAGSFAAVNALLTGTARLAGDMARQGLLPACGGIAERAWIIPLVLGAGIAGMMAAGMAGTDEIDVYLDAGLLLWMCNYAAIHIAVMRRSGIESKGWTIVPAVGASAMVISVLFLALTHPDREVLLGFAAISVSAITLFILAGRYFLNYKQKQTDKQGGGL